MRRGGVPKGLFANIVGFSLAAVYIITFAIAVILRFFGYSYFIQFMLNPYFLPIYSIVIALSMMNWDDFEIVKRWAAFGLGFGLLMPFVLHYLDWVDYINSVLQEFVIIGVITFLIRLSRKKRKAAKPP